MNTAAGATPQVAARICRRCTGRVTVTGGDVRWGLAVHTDSGKERGPDGHLVAPIDAELVRDARTGPGAGAPSSQVGCSSEGGVTR
jgi:hypothetical protein